MEEILTNMTWNPLRKCLTSGNINIYPVDGGFSLSLNGVWVEKAYNNLRDALKDAVEESQ